MITPFKSAILEDVPGIRHGFFTRVGGVSRGIYASLNCGLGSRDQISNVLENRARIARHLGSKTSKILTVYQVHSSSAYIADPNNLPSEVFPKADAIISKTPGLVIGVLTADCAPILFADSEAKVIAAAHAGWRGAVEGIIESTIEHMEKCGAVRSRICAAIGPTINQTAYEVGPEFKANLLSADEDNLSYFNEPRSGEKAHFDLPAYISNRLKKTGIQCWDSTSICTYDNESLFFSFRRATHRREADYGRQISAIVVT
ncbi:MAG: peptidoglycan editing factor PgeF [Hyphomicrobium sp.]